jgi:hypothetical protein
LSTACIGGDGEKKSESKRGKEQHTDREHKGKEHKQWKLIEAKHTNEGYCPVFKKVKKNW